MRDGDTQERVREVVRDLLAPDKPIERESRLIEDLGADSLDQVEIVMSVEEEFGVEIPDDDMNRVKTVGDLISLVDRLAA